MSARHRRKLGKKAARPDAVKLKLTKFIDPRKLPKPPRFFGHEKELTSSWGALGNDRWGDCFWAGSAHEEMLWNKMAGRNIVFNEETVLMDYAAATGFDPSNPDTDQGTDMQEGASYRRKVGIRDVTNTRHKIEAYLAIEAGDIEQLYYALYLFEAVGVGIQYPSSADAQFDARKPWSVAKYASVDGGHYIPMVAKRNHLKCVTWGREQAMTVGFYERYCDEAIAYISKDALVNNKSEEGFDVDGLLKALTEVTKL